MTKSILAGILIGVGDIALLQSDNKVIGAFLFSVALLSIIKLRLLLFTGQIGFVKTFDQLLRSIFILFGNIIGTLIPLQWMVGHQWTGYSASAAAKWEPGYIDLLAAGIFCGVLIHIAVRAKSEVITVLCIMTFIIAGFRHCIADFPFAIAPIASWSWTILLKWFMVMIGNSIGALFTEALIGETK